MSISILTPDLAEILKLGVTVGQTGAFGIVAGRCAAAQAEGLMKIREEKLYRRFVPSWKDFCPDYLHMSSSQADRIIRLWQQYGPGFFELSQLVRISPEFYRAIEPNIKEGALHFNGETIELDPENADKVAAAVAEMRRDLLAASRPETTAADRLEDFERKCQALISLYKEVISSYFPPEGDQRLRNAVESLAAEIHLKA